MTDRTRYLLMQDVAIKNAWQVPGYLWEADCDITFYRGEPGVYKWLENAAREGWPTFQILEPAKPLKPWLPDEQEILSAPLPERVTFVVDWIRYKDEIKGLVKEPFARFVSEADRERWGAWHPHTKV